ncbi:wd-40 repeat-containing protein msi2-related [Anaeramoeba flamelloides]|uniref:Wd-40 repeat-containing protein msi2-related n=1 Tax=Anaeramoeba flamelloides TaxID=1746091 RepID=A0ABQ8XDG6_9EUKA|nr:wd-40 repeat-containing protein msi2-related [Anaeramoeba flamelloides]
MDQKFILTNRESPYQIYISSFTIQSNQTGFFEIDQDNSLTSIERKINVPSEINRIALNKADPNILSGKTGEGKILIYDLNKPKNEDALIGTCVGHTAEGYGIDWNKTKKNQLLSGSYDNLINIYDITSVSNGIINPTQSIKIHDQSVEDVEWYPHNENMFGSVSDDKTLKMYDLREKKGTTTVINHKDETNSLNFHPTREEFVITGSSDNMSYLWDIRKPLDNIHCFASHSDSVYKVSWYPGGETFFASSSDDRKIILWDISKIGDEQSELDADEGPPELLFTHNGHKSVVRDFTWCSAFDWTIASVDDDSVFQIFAVNPQVFIDDLCEFEDDQLEYFPSDDFD